MARRSTSTSEPRQKRRPAMTQEAREAQLVALAYDRAEQRLLDGTASGQEITALIRLGSEKSKLEREKIRHETEVLKAKKEKLNSEKRTEEIYEKALAAMRSYNGIEDYEDDPYIL